MLIIQTADVGKSNEIQKPLTQTVVSKMSCVLSHCSCEVDKSKPYFLLPFNFLNFEIEVPRSVTRKNTLSEHRKCQRRI